MTIEIRRHHRQRLKAKRSYHWGRDISKTHEISKVVDTPTPCSCYMCGNERKHFKLRTVQERRAMQAVD